MNKFIQQMMEIGVLEDRSCSKTERDNAVKAAEELYDKHISELKLLGITDVMAKLPDEEMIKKMSQQYMVSNRTIGGGDAGWIQGAYKDGMRDLVKMLKGNCLTN